MLWLNVYYNHHVLNIIWRLWALKNNYATCLILNTNVWTTLKRYINIKIIVTTKKNLKYILDASMVSTPEGVKYDSTSVPMTSTPFKKPSARKSLCLSTNIFDIKKKTAKRRFGAEKSKRRAVKVDNSLWTKKTKRKGHSKINEHIKSNLYA